MPAKTMARDRRLDVCFWALLFIHGALAECAPTLIDALFHRRGPQGFQKRRRARLGALVRRPPVAVPRDGRGTGARSA